MRGFCLVESSPKTVESPTYCCSGQIQMYLWGYPTETVAMCFGPITVLVAYTLLPVSRVPFWRGLFCFHNTPNTTVFVLQRTCTPGNTLFVSCKGTAGIPDSTRGKCVHGGGGGVEVWANLFPPTKTLMCTKYTGMRVRYILR